MKTHSRPNWASRTVFASVALALAVPASAYDIFLDWSNSDVRFQFAWNTISANHPTDLTTAELATIKDAVKTNLETAYSAFNVSFNTSKPTGAFQNLYFGGVGGSTSFGTAFEIDWRNQNTEDYAEVYVHSFNANNNILVGSATRQENINYLINAISGTAAHEIGHDLGLQHYDCFCHDGNTYNGGYLIGDSQTNYIMATGSAGLTGPQRRENVRTFNTLETVKLEYANEVTPQMGKIVSEVEDNDSFAIAQEVTAERLSVSGVNAVLIEGSIGGATDRDYYQFTAELGNSITLNALSSHGYEDDVDTVVSLFDSSMNLLATNDNAIYGPQGLEDPTASLLFFSYDSLILNYEVGYTGIYYAMVNSVNGGTGNYDLLITGAVPEPATLALLAMGAAALARRRKSALFSK